MHVIFVISRNRIENRTEFLCSYNLAPTPIELIYQFLSIAPENQSNAIDITSPDIESALNKNEGLKIGHKQLALKILGLKVASHLKWNLGKILQKKNYDDGNVIEMSRNLQKFWKKVYLCKSKCNC